MRLAGCSLHQLRSLRQIKIDQLSATVANGMVMTISFAIVPAGAIAKTYFMNQTCFFQVTKRVINGCVADSGETLSRCFKNFARSWVIVTVKNHLKHGITLRRELVAFN